MSKTLAGKFGTKSTKSSGGGGGGGGGSSGGGGGGGGGGGKTPEQEAKEAADKWDEAMARAYAYGEISREEYRKYLEGQMADEDKYSDEYYKHWQERQRLDKEEADAKKKAADEERKALDEREKADKEQAKRDEEKIQRQQEIAAMFEADVKAVAAEPFGLADDAIGSGVDRGADRAGQIDAQAWTLDHHALAGAAQRRHQ